MVGAVSKLNNGKVNFRSFSQMPERVIIREWKPVLAKTGKPVKPASLAKPKPVFTSSENRFSVLYF